MFVKFRFRPKLWASIATCLGIAVTLALGNWQLNRAQEKINLQQRLQSRGSSATLLVPNKDADPQKYEWRRVKAIGAFVPKYTVLLDNKVVRGVVGYEVITPLRIEGSEKHILIDRGWIAAAARREHLPRIITPQEQVQVNGIATIPSRRIFELSQQTISGNVWENLVIERYRELFPLDVHGFIIEQRNPIADGLQPGVKRQFDTGIAKHQGYAFQWFALSVFIFIFYLATSTRKENE